MLVDVSGFDLVGSAMMIAFGIQFGGDKEVSCNEEPIMEESCI